MLAHLKGLLNPSLRRGFEWHTGSSWFNVAADIGNIRK